MKFFKDLQEDYFFSQPHQPFFVLAFVSALLTMLIFLLSYKGILQLVIPVNDFHAYGLTYLMFTPAFFAFLFTTFPRFTSTPTIKKEIYIRVFSFYYLGAILFLLGSIVSVIFSSLGMVLIFIGHALGTLILKNIYTKTTMEDKNDVYWILVAMSFGLLAHGIFLLGQLFSLSFIGFSTEICTYLFLFLLTFSVAQRMVPFFSHCMVDKNKNLLKILFILLSLHVLFDTIYDNTSFIIDFIISFIVARELIRWKFPFPHPNPLLLILHISLYWVPVAFVLSGLTNAISLFNGISFLALDIHSLSLGFVFSILIGFGTRVTIGHSGNVMQADNWVKGLFIWTQVVVSLRILLSFVASFGWDYMILFDISITAWLIMFVAWAIRFFAVLIKGKKLNH